MKKQTSKKTKASAEKEEPDLTKFQQEEPELTEFQRLIKDSGIMDKKYCDVLEVNFRTWKKKVEYPRDLTYDQIESLASLLKISFSSLTKTIKATPRKQPEE